MRRPQLIASVAFTLGLVFAARPASAGRVTAGYETSWGKAGVSLEQYWTDSATCGHEAAATDLTGTDPARALVLGSRLMDNPDDLEKVAMATRIAAPEIQWNRAATILQRNLETCLKRLGYVKFKLTRGQAHHLKKLEAGSLERRKYLYSLASDPAVLRAQTIRDS